MGPVTLLKPGYLEVTRRDARVCILIALVGAALLFLTACDEAAVTAIQACQACEPVGAGMTCIRAPRGPFQCQITWQYPVCTK